MLKTKVYIKEHAFVAKIAAYVLGCDNCAIVFRRTIYLHAISATELTANQSLLCHELVHVMQWRKYGMLRFPILYLWYSLVSGYYKNRFEIEARSKENDPSILSHFIIK